MISKIFDLSDAYSIMGFFAAAPIFKTLHDGPRDLNATAGDSISIHCNPHAIPPAEITWLRNGIPLTYGMQIVLCSFF